MNKAADFSPVFNFDGNNISSVAHCDYRFTQGFLILRGADHFVKPVAHL